MSYLTMPGVCMCGTKYEAKIKKPTRFQFTSTKVSCRNCASRFFISCLVNYDQGARVYNTHVDLMHLSKKAQKIVSDKLLEGESAS